MEEVYKIIQEQKEIITRQAGVILEQDGIIASLKDENVLLKARVGELERRLALDSTTSSKPPSSDGLKKQTRKPISLKNPSKPKGGQVGHKGKTLQQVDNPDEIHTQKVENCSQCGENLTHQPVKKFVKRQVFDIVIQRKVTEYQSEVKQCQCKAYTTAPFPEEVKGPVQLGKDLQAFMLALSEEFISKDRLSKVFSELFDIPISDTTILKYEGVLADNLEVFHKETLEYLKQTDVKHGDETGIRVGGKTHWIHVLSNLYLTCLWYSAKRKCTLSNIKGIFIHDHFKSYLKLEDPELIHAFCNGHILRELLALATYDKEKWAEEMSELFRLMCHAKNEGGLNEAKISEYRRSYETILARGQAYHASLPELSKPARGKAKKRPGANLLERLDKHKEGILLFLQEEAVPFTNNQAERDLRMVKLKQKVSGCFRTESGVKNFATIRSYISTAKKNGMNALDAIRLALDGPVRLHHILEPQVNI